jgi:hypothetical protein
MIRNSSVGPESSLSLCLHHLIVTQSETAFERKMNGNYGSLKETAKQNKQSRNRFYPICVIDVDI